jgi:hypothetical protein
MAAIKTDFGTGGSNLTPGGSSGSPSLAEALRDVADDLAALKPAAPTAVTVGADIAAFTDPPSAAEMALLRTFVNALKADAAAVRAVLPTGATLKTTKV